MRVLVTGSSGFIGSALVEALAKRGDSVTALRHGTTGALSWDPEHGVIAGSLDGHDAVINLAGESIGHGRWNHDKKRKILDSRIKGTDALARALAALDEKPAVLLNGSAIGFYGNRGREELLNEESTPGDDFLATLCKDWEAATSPASEAGIRVAHIRTGIVLSPEGGALKQMLLPFKLGVGGKLGNGRQYMSWISLADEVRAILHVLDTSQVDGAVNLTAPHPVTNEVFTQLLGEAMHRPTFMPVPSFALRALLGAEMANTMILAGQRVFPKKLEATGFSFENETLEQALHSLFASR